MLICHLDDCTCAHHRLLGCIKNGMYKKAKSILQSIENHQDLTDEFGLTLLHLSVQYNNLEMVQALADEGHDINAQDSTGVTPLMLALKNNNIEMVEVLLKNNADIYLADDKEVNSLQLAVDYWLKVLYKNPNARSFMEMFFDKINKDFSMDNQKITQFLEKSHISVKFATVVFGNYEITTFLLNNGYKVNYCVPELNRMTALHCATEFGRIDNCKLLINRDKHLHRMDRVGFSSLYNYTKRMESVDEQSEVLKYFLKCLGNEISPKPKKRRELENLLRWGKKKTVKAVLQSDVYMDVSYKNICLLLHVLINNKDDDVLDLFEELDIKFDVNRFNMRGSTALMVTVNRGCLRKVEFLLKHKADINLKTLHGHSALYFAVANDNWNNNLDLEENVTKIVELLLEHGADAQIVTRNGQSIIDIISHKSERLLTKIIIAHLAMLGAVNESPLSDFTRDNIKKYPALQTQFDLCTQQLERMKQHEVYGTATLFKLLTERDDKIMAYVRNVELTSSFKIIMERKPQLEPYYANTLQKRVGSSIHRIELEDKAALPFESFSKICSDVHRDIVCNIFGYLNNKDLINLYEAGNILLTRN